MTNGKYYLTRLPPIRTINDSIVYNIKNNNIF